MGNQSAGYFLKLIPGHGKLLGVQAAQAGLERGAHSGDVVPDLFLVLYSALTLKTRAIRRNCSRYDIYHTQSRSTRPPLCSDLLIILLSWESTY